MSAKKLAPSSILDTVGLGQRIEALRTASGENQPELAAALSELLGPGNEVSRSLVSLWETAQRIPRTDHILALAHHFKVDCTYLITGVNAAGFVTASDLGLSGDIVNSLSHIQQDSLTADFTNRFLRRLVRKDALLIIAYLMSNAAAAGHNASIKGPAAREPMRIPGFEGEEDYFLPPRFAAEYYKNAAMDQMGDHVSAVMDSIYNEMVQNWSLQDEPTQQREEVQDGN